jgi:hypothetical protein
MHKYIYIFIKTVNLNIIDIVSVKTCNLIANYRRHTVPAQKCALSIDRIDLVKAYLEQLFPAANVRIAARRREEGVQPLDGMGLAHDGSSRVDDTAARICFIFLTPLLGLPGKTTQTCLARTLRTACGV